jgi:2-keto-4-pentenoate hydratase/2-oxohepta-3-ene-1,7-dioic acid hydratase in catechol pathway
MELGFIVGSLASGVKEKDAGNYILGYLPLISLSDTSFKKETIEPATPQEKGICEVYGRWGDGYNILGQGLPLSWETLKGAKMRLESDFQSPVITGVDEYRASPERILAFISKHITLFPGDVVIMGRVSERLFIPAGKNGAIKLNGVIEGAGSVTARIAAKKKL